MHCIFLLYYFFLLLFFGAWFCLSPFLALYILWLLQSASGFYYISSSTNFTFNACNGMRNLSILYKYYFHLSRIPQLFFSLENKLPILSLRYALNIVLSPSNYQAGEQEKLIVEQEGFWIIIYILRPFLPLPYSFYTSTSVHFTSMKTVNEAEALSCKWYSSEHRAANHVSTLKLLRRNNDLTYHIDNTYA